MRKQRTSYERRNVILGESCDLSPLFLYYSGLNLRSMRAHHDLNEMGTTMQSILSVYSRTVSFF